MPFTFTFTFYKHINH